MNARSEELTRTHQGRLRSSQTTWETKQTCQQHQRASRTMEMCRRICGRCQNALENGLRGELEQTHLRRLETGYTTRAVKRSMQTNVKTVQTSRRNSGNSGVGRSWLGLGLSLCAMPLLLIGSWRSRADQNNSETLVMSTSSR